MDGFYGEYNVNLDEKGRIALPSKIRPRQEDGSALKLTLAPGLEAGCLTIYTPEIWQSFKADLKSISYGSKDMRAYSRYLFSKVASVVPDKQGRFLIPANLISFAGLRDQALVIGVDDLIEIWDPEKYSGYIAEREENGTIIDTSERLWRLRNGLGGGQGHGGEAE